MRFSGVSANSAPKEQRMIAVSVISFFMIVAIGEVNIFVGFGKDIAFLRLSDSKVRYKIRGVQILYI